MAKQTSSPDSFPEFPEETFTPNGTPPLEAGPDPFDPETLRLPPDYAIALGAKKALVDVPVRRPAKEWFFRTHPASQLETTLIELKETRELYLLNPALREYLAGESTLTRQMLYLAVTRQGTVFFFPVKLPGPDGRLSSWTKSALEAAQIATTKWVRMVPDQQLGGYHVWYAEFTLEPEWPEHAMRDLLRIAFKDTYIDTWEHPVLRQLRGEV